MPISDIVDVYDGPEEVADHAAEVYAAVFQHCRELREVRARGGRGARGGRPRTLVPSTRFQLDIEEDPAELARKTARRLIEQITADAAGEAWRGVVELVGDPSDSGKANILTSVKIELSAGAPQPKPTRDDELTGLIAAMSKTIADLGAVIVRVGSTKADELQAYSSMVVALAESVRQTNKSDGKWAWKMHKESEETERVREESHERAARSAHRWAAFEVFAEEWSGVAEIWSAYFASGNREIPKRPTEAELQGVFVFEGASVDGVPWSDVFDPIRAIVATMLAEPDPKRRCAIAKDELRGAINALSKNAQDAMKLRMLSVLGADRTKEVAAWLSLPIS